MQNIYRGGLIVAIGVATLSVPAHAAGQERSFNIPQQPLEAALQAFGLQANQQLSFRPEDVRGYSSQTLVGSYAPALALQMLVGPNPRLAIGQTSSGVFVVRRKQALAMAQTASAVMSAAAAQAEAPPQADDTAQSNGGLQDIVVTATRREEQLQRVPVSISALTSDAIDKLQIRDVRNLERVVPSLNVSRAQGDRTSTIVTLRGLVQTDQLTNIDPAAGLYLDGIYVARATGSNAALVDIGRVEVLRGPQGTLFGRNTIGGAINIVPNKPTQELGGSVELGVGNYDTFRGVGVLNLPVNDNLAVRLTGAHIGHSGYAKHATTGEDLGDIESNFFRAQALYTSGDWSFLLAGDYAMNSYDGEWTTSLGFTEATAAASLAALAPYANRPYTRRPAPNDVGPFRGKAGGVSGTITGSLGSATVKSITAYRIARKHYRALDLDSTPFLIQGQLDAFSRQHQFSEELQVFGKAFDSRLDWIVGGFYFEERGIDNTIQYAAIPQPVPAGQLVNRTQSKAHNKSVGIYAQLTYNITDALRLTGGVRYTKDTREVTVQNANLFYATLVPTLCTVAGAGPAPACSYSPPSKSFNYVPFMIGADYRIADTLLYAKFSRGFRSGGFNTRPAGSTPAAALAAQTSINAPFSPEKVNSYELGVKADLLDRHLRVNLAAYQADYTNIQLSLTVPAPPPASSVSYTTNAGEARIRGAEAEVTAILGNLTLGATAGLVDAKYTKLLPGVNGVLLASKFQLVPKYSYALSADYVVPASFGEFTLHTDWNYKSRINFALIPPGNLGAFQPGYGLLNASLDLKLSENPISVTLWMQNILDKRYAARGLVIPGAAAGSARVIMAFPGDPRTFGLTAKYSF